MSVFRAILRNGNLKWCASSSKLIKISFDLPATACHCRCKGAISVPTISTTRHYSSRSEPATAADNTDDKKVLIYEGMLIKNIRNLKIFTLCTSTIGLSVQPFVYQKAMEAGTINSMTLPLFTLVGIFAIGTPLMIHAFTRRYVLYVHYFPEEDKYMATTFNLFAREKKTEFTVEDVTVPTVLGMFCSCAIKGKKFFLDAKCFFNQDHYIRLMGYDKPVDLDPTNNTKEPQPKKESN
ncbi:hypothetical protein QAD02_001111 [Eretmocerus hayati]|uniref:Uncharacterized protein n=1 Tax=Eretmocerus hayati TaxID=131215 RepID=A0ACC2NHY1_9HYME|nr:hypothetical protein QAD02_001111 [Eretmocerus hayati]